MTNFNFASTQQLYQKEVFDKFPNFEPVLKDHQARGIHYLLNGEDLLFLAPTAYGKTLTILAAPLILAQQNGIKIIHLIVSPLLALSAQISERILQHGLHCFHLHGDNVHDMEALMNSYDLLPPGSVLHLITSPELLMLDEIKESLKCRRVEGFSIDEGHVIADWSPNFRKAYGGLNTLRSFIKCPIGVFSATVTPDQRSVIMDKVGFRLNFMQEIVLSPDRPEIYLEMKERKVDFANFIPLVEDLAIRSLTCKKILIFCNFKNTVTELFLWLRSHIPLDSAVVLESGVKVYMVEMYTGSTNEISRIRIETDFCSPSGYVRILVATNAFGMGMNVPGLHNVIIYEMPKSIGDIIQLGGRASRDGAQGNCTILTPKVSKNPVTVSLKQSECMRQPILDAFCKPTPQLPSTQPMESEFDHKDCLVACVCPSCRCCTNCGKKCECGKNKEKQ